jgi:serine/threonine-protein kinase ATR
MMAAYASRNSRAMPLPASFDPILEKLQISRVEHILQYISPITIALRAIECKSFSRAVFHLEEDIRQRKGENLDDHLKYLQTVYEQINEPDAMEGTSACIQIVDLTQQVLDHKRSGRWTAALSWYEIKANEQPADIHVHLNLLSCLKASSQYDALLNAVKSYTIQTPDYYSATIPFASEAAWMTGRFDILEDLMINDGARTSQDFNAGVARVLLAQLDGSLPKFYSEVSELRASISRSISPSTTMSLTSAHSHMLKLHVLYELEMLSGFNQNPTDAERIMLCLDRRLDIIGSFTEDKQYILGIRRAAMEISRFVHTGMFYELF